MSLLDFFTRKKEGNKPPPSSAPVDQEPETAPEPTTPEEMGTGGGRGTCLPRPTAPPANW